MMRAYGVNLAFWNPGRIQCQVFVQGSIRIGANGGVFILLENGTQLLSDF